ncbi:MAG: sulfotransferase [Gemmatimonadetes bacterium]|nr:sulfotransferase [Gemmatimonadota bacterium]
MTATPDFFIAGVPKAGTTSLYRYLSQHPQIYMSPVKEPTFFAAADLLGDYFTPEVRTVIDRNRRYVSKLVGGPMQERVHRGLALDWDTYLKLFRNARDEIAIGEASVSYWWLPSAAPAIRTRVPGAKLIFVLRSPAERIFSQYLDSTGYRPGVPFRARFLAAKEGRDVWSTALGIDRYATNLRRFFELFPREQMRIYLYEEYRADPARRTSLRFLASSPRTSWISRASIIGPRSRNTPGCTTSGDCCLTRSR